MSITTTGKPKWTTETLIQLYSVDAAAAFLASFFVAPFITIVDRSIIENANGKTPLATGLRQGLQHLVTRPHRFVATPQFRLILGLYFSTYLTANAVTTTCEHLERDASAPKLVSTTLVNMSLCIYKDRAFTRMFGLTAARPLPLATYGLFASRDALTVAASFNAPEVVSAALVRYGAARDKRSADTVAQLVCPAAVQFLSTPIHLLGLDLYNRPGASAGQRVALVGGEYLKSAIARIARIAPAFGIGGIGNARVRAWRERILEKAEIRENEEAVLQRMG